MAKTSKGRQRVEMVKMQNENNLQVTFSKRRAGLFKKASELSTLCGVDVGIIVFSPGKKVFSFGHPSVEAVVERFLGGDDAAGNGGGGVASTTEQLIEAHRNARVQELSVELTRLEAMIVSEKKRGEAIDEAAAANREAQGWVRGSHDELSLEQLQALKNGMENLMRETHQKAQQLMAMQGNSGFPFNPYASGGVFSGGALPFNSGVAGAHPFNSGGAAAASSSSHG
ncbi:agamous-like MADS-box protein AGL62 [Ipomoea triloba]|uniref:agamous-like MADS-box protein AGL62 n=1 Tax=Ipomoea triloba TaxID=35885 RepID=UPI00125DCA06|nr:agamous-like MADS-box protein AGL62 [Ipomoea triloba]